MRNQVDILVVDECSMINGGDLHQMHLQLQKARDRFEEDVGGMPIVILCSDFYQFEPVQGVSMLYPGRGTPQRKFQETGELFDIKNKEQLLGHKLWLKFNTVILLDEQMRTADMEFASLLGRLRLGVQTEQDANTLNAKLALLQDIKDWTYRAR
ncbi:hypothetical protein F4804DRAFT_337174 [Jackrogersella minutella]|nr:hypothetical protein F4804DRAFT_337174 [Jackrogersella minutella]